MSWTKDDDALHSHPKFMRAGDAAIGQWTICKAWSSAYKQGGFVPRWYVEGRPQGIEKAERLVAVGLWEVAEKDGEDGWVYHDWLDYQPSVEEQERQAAYNRDRQRRHRERKAEARDKGKDKGDAAA